MSKILNLKQYDLVFTTSFIYTHGVSGHLYELIDYCYICYNAGIKSAILLADGLAKSVFTSALLDKYNFTETELAYILDNTYECHQPKVLMVNNLCLVDGSHYLMDSVIYADNAFLLRCSEDDFDYFSNHKSIKCSHVMQDFDLYPERYEHLNVQVVPYVKKILWGKYHKPRDVKTNTGMFYLTTNCRAISKTELETIMAKQYCDKYLIITNKPEIYADMMSDTVRVELAPIKDIFEQFDTYIYTQTELKKDCSPRFIVECAVYGKQVVYEIAYTCGGVERRRTDIANNLAGLELLPTDDFIQYVKRFI